MAAYDTYNYQAYWEGREYEHDAETIAIEAFLAKIPKIDTTLEIGAGFGRLVDVYAYRAKRVILTDPSGKLLRAAREMHASKKFKFVRVSAENLPKKFRRASVDLVVLVRVLHHLADVKKVFCTVNRLLVPGGYFILEFANKRHWKIMTKEMLKGNILFPAEIFPKDISTQKNRLKRTLPFVNYHPDAITKMLGDCGFNIIEKRSVSNIRIPYLKKLLPIDVLLGIEKQLQTLLAPFNFGPSIFMLIKKTDNY